MGEALKSNLYCDVIQLSCTILMRPAVNEVYRVPTRAKRCTGRRAMVVEEQSFDLLQKTYVRSNSVTCDLSICGILL